VIGVSAAVALASILIVRDMKSTSRVTAHRTTTATVVRPIPPSALTVSSWGDSMASETSQFLLGALDQQTTTHITFESQSFPGISVCNDVDSGDMAADATSVEPQVVALQFSGDLFTPCAVRLGKGRPLADYAQMSAGDLKAAIEIYLRQDPRLEHVAVLLPPPSSPGGTQAYVTLLDADYKVMVRALGDPRVTVAYGPAASVSKPDGAFTWTLPCTRQEKLAGVCFGPGGVNTVRSPTGHFCIPTSCTGFQPGAWRFVNAEAKDLLAPFGITIHTTIASGYTS
jgi:uncharacterized membrane protein